MLCWVPHFLLEQLCIYKNLSCISFKLCESPLEKKVIPVEPRLRPQLMSPLTRGSQAKHRDWFAGPRWSGGSGTRSARGSGRGRPWPYLSEQPSWTPTTYRSWVIHVTGCLKFRTMQIHLLTLNMVNCLRKLDPKNYR